MVTLKQIVGNLPTICLSVFDHFMNLALKGLINVLFIQIYFLFVQKCCTLIIVHCCTSKNAVTPIFKKELKSKVENYRSVSILPSVSKLFERPLFDQISLCLRQILSDHICGGFRKTFNPQHCLIAITEK